MPEVEMRKPSVEIVTTAQAAAAVDLSGSAVLVIDVLRATTSVQCIFFAGASAVYPVGSVEDARALKRERPGALLCGERKGTPLEGFDMGNSPADFAGADLRDREVILTTTNGTLAVENAADSGAMFSACMLNARTAAIRAASRLPEAPLFIVCAGTAGRFSIEDFYCAGLAVSELLKAGKRRPTDLASAAAILAEQPVERVVNTSTCNHLEYLITIGFERDIKVALSPEPEAGDRIVPVYLPEQRCFIPAGNAAGTEA